MFVGMTVGCVTFLIRRPRVEAMHLRVQRRAGQVQVCSNNELSIMHER